MTILKVRKNSRHCRVQL